MSGELVHKPLPTIPPYKSPQPTNYHRIVRNLTLHMARSMELWGAWEKKRKGRS